MAYQQAQIPVQKTEEFEHLRAAIERVFAPGAVEKYFKKLQSADVHIRQFETRKSKLETRDSRERGVSIFEFRVSHEGAGVTQW